jgi:hypothetical protein
MLSLDATLECKYFIYSACLLLIGLAMSADVDWLVDFRCVSIVRHVGNDFHYHFSSRTNAIVKRAVIFHVPTRLDIAHPSTLAFFRADANLGPNSGLVVIPANVSLVGTNGTFTIFFRIVSHMMFLDIKMGVLPKVPNTFCPTMVTGDAFYQWPEGQHVQRSNPVRIQGPVGPSDQSGGDDTWRTGAEHLSDSGIRMKAVFDSLSAEAQIVRPLAPPITWLVFLRRTFSGGRGPWLTRMWRASPPNHSGVIPASQALATFIPNSSPDLV